MVALLIAQSNIEWLIIAIALVKQRQNMTHMVFSVNHMRHLNNKFISGVKLSKRITFYSLFDTYSYNKHILQLKQRNYSII